MRTLLSALLLAALRVPAFSADTPSFESMIDAASKAFMQQKAAAPLSRAIVDQPLVGLIAQAQPSVATVIVSQTKTKGGLLSWALGRELKVPTGTALGTGWVARSKDSTVLLVTNAHVVAGRAVGGKVFVQFDDHANLEATVVGKNVKKDLALIEVEIPAGRPSRNALPLGSSASLRQGQRLLALGSPLGLRQTATAGIFSASGLNPEYYPGGYLQTDLAINHGNSGGPLLDLDGDVVGVNFAIPGEGTGLGLAIPVEFVKQALAQYDANRELSNAYLGATFVGSSWMQTDAVSNLRAKLGGHELPHEGAWIKQVQPGSPADKAGLEEGDRVLAVDGQALPAQVYDAVGTMIQAVALRSPEDTMTMLVERGGVRSNVVVTLEKAHE